MAVRNCPLCGAKIESWPGQPLRVSAVHHKVIAHAHVVDEELRRWREFMHALPPLR